MNGYQSEHRILLGCKLLSRGLNVLLSKKYRTESQKERNTWECIPGGSTFQDCKLLQKTFGPTKARKNRKKSVFCQSRDCVKLWKQDTAMGWLYSFTYLCEYFKMYLFIHSLPFFTKTQTGTAARDVTSVTSHETRFFWEQKKRLMEIPAITFKI